MKAIVFGFLAILAMCGIAVGIYFLLPQESAHVTLGINRPQQVLVGQPFQIELAYSNASDKPVKAAKLALLMPEGISAVGKSEGLRVIEESLGDIAPGVSQKKSFTLIALGDPQTVRHLEAKITYGTGVNPKVQFESKEEEDILVGQSAVALTFDVPEKVFNGEEFKMEVSYENAAETEFEDLSLKLEFPPVFVFISSDVPPRKGSYVWDLGKLEKGAKGKIIVRGTMIGPEQSFYAVKGQIVNRLDGAQYPITNQDASLSISVSPLSLSIQIDRRGPEHVVKAGDVLTYALTYKNNSNVTFENVVIRASLLGEMFDFPTLKSTAFFDSRNHSLLWNAANTPSLARLMPGQIDKVELNVTLRPGFPIRQLSDKNFTIKIKGEIESQTVPDRTGAAKTISLAELTNKVAGLTTVEAKGFFRDPASGIANTGPFPPIVNQPTQYTVHWVVRNYSTDVTNVRVSAFLQSNTRFTGVAKSTIGSAPRYNAASGEVVWEIANMPATKGVVGDTVEAIFQIENVPAINQVQSVVTLLGATQISSNDQFTGTQISGTGKEITTNLPDDMTLGSVQRTVQAQ